MAGKCKSEFIIPVLKSMLFFGMPFKGIFSLKIKNKTYSLKYIIAP